MTDEPRVEWTDAEHVSGLLDVTTAACSSCKGAAGVPEDVVAVYVDGNGVKTAIVICDACTPAFLAEMREQMEKRMGGGAT